MIDNTQYDNIINLVNTEEEAGIKYINSINETDHLSINDDNNYIHK